MADEAAEGGSVLMKTHNDQFLSILQTSFGAKYLLRGRAYLYLKKKTSHFSPSAVTYNQWTIQPLIFPGFAWVITSNHSPYSQR